MCYNVVMDFVSKIIICCIYLLSTVSFARDSRISCDANFVAEQAASFINEMGNWENVLKLLEVTEGKNQVKAIREVFKDKIDTHAAFPKIFAKQNKIYLSNGRFLTINKDRTVNYQGMIFHEPNQALDLYLKEALERLNGSVASFSFFIEAAEAAPTYNSQEGKGSLALVALMAVGVAAIYLGSGLVIANVGAALAVGAVVGAVVLVGNKAYQKIRRGEVECHGSEYYIRYQPNDSFTSEQAPIPHQEKIFPKDEDGKPLPCTPARAKALQDFLAGDPYVDRLESRPSNPGAVR